MRGATTCKLMCNWIQIVQLSSHPYKFLNFQWHAAVPGDHTRCIAKFDMNIWFIVHIQSHAMTIWDPTWKSLPAALQV